MEYVYLYPELNLVEYVYGNKEVVCLSITNKELAGKVGKQGQLNEIGREILLLFDGTRSFQNIILNLCKKYNETYESVEVKVLKFLEIINCQYGYEMRRQALPQKRKIVYNKYKNMYPSAASVELTNNCNIRCRHCYGYFGESALMRSLELSEIETLIEDLNEIGIRVLELTGGDPTVNIYCKDAVRIACEKGIPRVMLLTNGINMSEELVEVLREYRDRVYVQVDLHSLNNNFYDWFTKSSGNLCKVKENINRLVNNNIKTRVCAIFLPGNLHEIEEIAQWAFEHGAFQFAPSIVTPVGRAKRESTLDLNEGQVMDFVNRIEVLKQKYPGFVSTSDKNTNVHRTNCGALTSEISINAFGEIKLCAMDSRDYFDLGFENVFDKKLKEILDENGEVLDALRELKLPDLESEECKECEKRAFCHQCIHRGIIASIERGEKCNWRANMNPILRERIYRKNVKGCCK